MFSKLDPMSLPESGWRRARPVPLWQVSLTCALAGAFVGMVSAVAMLLSGALGSGAGEDGALGIGALLLGMALVGAGFAAPIGACVGAVLGLACTPLALLLGEREDVLRRIGVTALVCVPVAIACGFAEEALPIVFGVGLSAVAIFLAQVPRLGAPLRAFAILAAMLVGPTLLGPRILRRHALPESVPGLVVKLRTNDTMLRDRARVKLERVGGKPGLLRALVDQDPRARRSAAIALQRYPSDDVRAALELACMDLDEYVARSAQHSLSVIAWERDHAANR